MLTPVSFGANEASKLPSKPDDLREIEVLYLIKRGKPLLITRS